MTWEPPSKEDWLGALIGALATVLWLMVVLLWAFGHE